MAATTGAPLREIQEVRNAIQAYERYSQWKPCSEADRLDRLDPHANLMAGLLDAPDRYRRGGIAVAGGGAVHHIGPPADSVQLSDHGAGTVGSTMTQVGKHAPERDVPEQAVLIARNFEEFGV